MREVFYNFRDMRILKNNLWMVAAVFFIAVLGCSKSSDSARKRAESKEAVEKLNAVANDFAKLPPKEQLTNEPYIKGKIVVVRQNDGGKPYVNNMDNKQFGETYANTPEEVQTVALLSCTKTQRGVYRTKENPPRELPAYSNDCDLTLVDRTIPAVIFKKRFEGTVEETTSVTANTKEIIKYAEHDIREFFKSLPRK
jgi:hypothetical protein